MKVYLGLDGNRIGSHVESALILGDLAGIEQLSQKVTDAVQAIERRILCAGGRVVFVGGDSVFAEIEYDLDFCQELLDDFYQVSGCKAAAGVGRTPLDAFLALRLAKSDAALGNSARVKVYGSLDNVADPAYPCPVFRGLVWLLGPGGFEHLMVAIRHHSLRQKRERRLEHCWLIMTQEDCVAEVLPVIIETLKLQDLSVQVHPIRIPEPTPEAVRCAVESVYAYESTKYGLTPAEIIADITGGLKTMTMGMALACLSSGYPIEYVASRRDIRGDPIPGTQRVLLLNPPL